MGRANSPLRDRVVFVEGAPRSGTTWLVTLLATHPAIAGTQAESHLFDYGVDRLFDNIEHRDPHLHGLDRYLEREELVDLARDLCDGVLQAMRSHVAGAAEPGFVVEKTPIGARADGLDLERKRDCYPDAWYIHIVRDRKAVIRSLMGAPFMPDRSFAACAVLWDRSVGSIRRQLGDQPKYREVAYEQLRSDPAEVCRDLFDWLGIEVGEEELETVRALSRERFSDLGTDSPAERPTLRTVLRRVLTRVRSLRSAPTLPEGSRLVFQLVLALRRSDLQRLDEITHHKLEVEVRSPQGDELSDGDAGRRALAQLAEDVFNRRYAGEWWASAGGAGEWFTSAPGKPFWTLFFSRLGSDATRVDLALGLTLEEGVIRRVVIVSAGPFAGRPIGG